MLCSQIATFIVPESAPETALESMYFMLFLKNLTIKFGEKAVFHICLDGIDPFYKYFFFLHATSFLIGENSPAMHGWRKIVFMKPHVYEFLFLEALVYLYLLKIIIKVDFFGNIFPKP